MARPDLTELARALHRDTLEGLNEALEHGTATLVARIGDGERPLVAQMERPHFLLDATLYSSREAMRMELLRNVVAALVGGDPGRLLTEPTPAGDRARLVVSEAYGRDAGRVIRLLEGPPVITPKDAVGLSLATIFQGAPIHDALVVTDAHRLDTDARWDLRELDRPLLFVTGPGHLDSLVASDAPFYGQTQTIRMGVPSIADWGRVLAELNFPLLPSDLDWLLLRTRQRVGTTYDALKRVAPSRSIRTAWSSAVRDAIPRAHNALLLASAVHELAPRLLSAIAQGRKPYPEIPEASNQRVALALRKMRDLDLLEQMKPPVWQVADPLLQHAFVAMVDRDRVRVLQTELSEESAPHFLRHSR